MATEFVRVKHVETGAVTSLPLTALQHLPNWQQVDGPPPGRPKPRRPKPRRPKPNRTPPPAPDGDQSQQPDAADAASTEQE